MGMYKSIQENIDVAIDRIKFGEFDKAIKSLGEAIKVSNQMRVYSDEVIWNEIKVLKNYSDAITNLDNRIKQLEKCQK